MPRYLFKAKNTSGNIVSGSLQANDDVQAEDMLLKNNLILVDLEAVKTPDYFSFLHRFSLRDRLMFTRQLSTMIAAGVSIPKALSIIASQTQTEFVKNVYSKLIDEIEKGQTFSSALGRFPTFFSPVMISVVRAGEQTGNLEQVLAQLAKQFERDYSLSAKVRNAMIYPVVVLCIMLVIATGMMIFIIPKFKEIFKASNVELPIATKILISISDSMVNFWYFYLVGIIALLLALRSFLISDYGRYYFDSFKLKVPIAKSIFKGIYMAHLSQTLAMMNRSGVPILETIRVISSVISNQVYSEALVDAAAQVERGMPLSAPLAKNSYFPILVAQMVAVGEQTGHLENVMDNLGNYYEEETDQKIKGLASLIEPLIMVVLGVGVAFIVISVLTPIYKIAQAQ